MDLFFFIFKTFGNSRIRGTIPANTCSKGVVANPIIKIRRKKTMLEDKVDCTLVMDFQNSITPAESNLFKFSKQNNLKYMMRYFKYYSKTDLMQSNSILIIKYWISYLYLKHLK